MFELEDEVESEIDVYFIPEIENYLINDPSIGI
jgi:hypothetical protein